MKKLFYYVIILAMCLFSSQAIGQFYSPDFPFTGPTDNNTVFSPGYYGEATYSDSPYTDTENYNHGYGWDSNTGMPGHEIWYKFSIAGDGTVNISNCGSDIDTYVYLLDENGYIIASNDDDGPLCSGTSASLSQYLTAGTYYVLSAPYNFEDNGHIVTSISSDVPPPVIPPPGASISSPIFVYSFEKCIVKSFTDIENNNPVNNFGNEMGQPSDDVYYTFDVTSPTTMNISLCGSNFNTYLHLLKQTSTNGVGAPIYTEIAANDDNGPLCTGTNASIQQNLEIGHYIVVAEGSGTAYGDLNISIYTTPDPSPPAGHNLANAINAGTLTPETPFSNTFTPSGCYEDGGCYYKFTLNDTAQVSISNCGSASDNSTLKLVNKNGQTFLTSAMNGPLCTGSLASIKTGLPAGTYYVLAVGFKFDPSITTTISVTATGATPIDTTGLNFTCSPLASAPSSNQNYVRTYSPRIAIDDATGIDNHTVCEVNETVAYYDGLGRPLQTVSVNANPSGTRDIVQPIAYDQFGREATKYLPYTVDTGYHASYRPYAITDAKGVYTNSAQYGFYTKPGQNYALITAPFASTVFEASPQNRLLEQGAPGDAWQLTGTGTASGQSGHTVKVVYTINDTTTYRAKKHGVSINATTGGRALIDQGIYDANQLYVTVTKDENWTSAQSDARLNTTEEYKDQDGHVVLKRIYNSNTSTTPALFETLSTYYVYDDIGSLSFVLPPKAEPDAGINSAGNQSTIDALCYQYHYDYRNRLIEKRIPGSGWQYIVYNKLDRVVATQDSNQRVHNLWEFTKYDKLGRVVITGLWNNNSAAISRAGLQITIDAWTGSQWESRPTGSGNSNVAWPVAAIGSTVSYFTVNYYDDYTYPDNPYNTWITGTLANPTGLLTATLTNVLNADGTYGPQLWTVNYYDSKGRIAQTFKQHYLGGAAHYSTSNYDATTYLYNFDNQPSGTYRYHYDNNVQTLRIDNAYFYDHMGRKKQTYTAINNISSVLQSQVDYNEIGQISTKHLHSENDGASFLQHVAYTYNERGWLTNANSSKFNLNLAYNNGITTGATPQFNGNIAEMYSTSDHTAAGSKMKYTYDVLNRLTAADHSNGLLTENGITYDKMGNIQTLNRSGASAANLTYTYSGNQLTTVLNNGSTFRTYSYDGNGNATTDGGSKNISYNLLNLPATVSLGGTTLATYTYDATGDKISNTGSDGTWDYIDGIVYHNGAIDFIQTEEGRAIPNGTSYSYQYNLKDHLGNNRVSMDKNGVLQEDEYYSFGLRNPKYDNSNNNRYLYNGKEIQTDLANQYDYGARFYDPVIARFTSVDPLATKYPWYSQYQFAGNEVPNAIDRDGMEPAYPKPDGSYTIARDGQLQKPLTDPDGKAALAHVAQVGGADKVPGLVKDFTSLALSILGPINTLVAGEMPDGSKANGWDYAAAPLQILTSLPIEGGEGPVGLETPGTPIPDNATVVRGGLSTPEQLATGSERLHPSGVPGFSVECGTCSVKDLAGPIKNGSVGVTSVGEVRAAGGDVIRTKGTSPYHATVTGINPTTASNLMNVIKNPAKVQ